MNLHLKVKINSLAAESKIIRQFQKRLLKRVKPPRLHIHVIPKGYTPTKEDYDFPEDVRVKLREDRIKRKLYKAQQAKIKMAKSWSSLQEHRRGIVREESRHSNLAYGFLRNKPYKEIEQSTWVLPHFPKIYSIARRFSDENDKRVFDQKFEQWKQEAHLVKRGHKWYSSN